MERSDNLPLLALGALGVVLVLVALFLAFGPEDLEEVVPPRSGTAATLEPERAAANEREGLSVPPVKHGEGATPAAKEAAPTVRGRVTLLDPDGIELSPTDGVLTLIAGTQQGVGVSLETTVARGEWSLELKTDDPTERISVRDLVVAGVHAAIEAPKDIVPLPADGFLEIRARMPKRSILRVVDAETGADLADVLIVRATGNERHPGAKFEERLLARGLVSPIDLDASLPLERRFRRQRFQIGAAGRAWSPLVFDFALGGERVVALARGGGLEVILSGAGAARHTELRIREDGHPAPVWTLAATKEQRIDLPDFAPGRFTISGEVGDWWAAPVVLGQVEAVVTAGATTTVTLVLSAPPDLELADIAGIVLVPEAWQPEAVLLRTDLLGTPLAGSSKRRSMRATRIPEVRNGCAVFTWKLEKLQVGRHELGLMEPSFSIAIDVPRGGRSDYVLEIPPPCELRVRITDAETGELVETDQLQWNPVRPEGVTGGSAGQADRDPRTGEYAFRAPCTKLELSIWDARYLPYDETFDATSSGRMHAIRLEPACGLLLSLRDGETAVPFPAKCDTQPEAAPGTEGRCGLITFGETERRFQVTAPGSYTLTIPTIPGYEPVPVQTVTVRAREFVPVVVQLVREHH